MAMSTFQKVTLVTCLVLCVALLLPKMLLSRGRKDAERPEGAGRFPPMMHRQMAPEGRGQRGSGSGFSRAHNSEAAARVKGSGSGGGTGTGGKSNLAGQIIPVYGFGILLYILYILFKITSKGGSKPAEGRTPSTRSENMKRKITDYELAQLQEKLRETELVMENIVSNAHHSPDRLKGVTLDQEESLLLQLTEITRVMQEGQLVDAVEPQKKKVDDQWEDYPEEPRPYWEHSHCCCQHSQEDQSESTTERTQGDGADGAGTGTDGAETGTEGAETGAEEAETGTEEAETSTEGAESGAEHTMSGGQMDEDNSTYAEKTESEVTSGHEDKHEQEEGGGNLRVREEDLGVQEEDLRVQEEDLRVQEEDLRVQKEDLAGVLQDVVKPAQTVSSISHVRRRNRRRRTKKDLN